MKVLLDANILYPPTLRDLLLLLAKESVFDPFWSETIIEEWQYNVVKQLNKSQQLMVRQLCTEMNQDFPNATISGYESMIAQVRSRDEDDKHVVAAAIFGKVDYLMTFNVRDFPKSSLRPYGITPIHPDRWLCDFWDKNIDVLHRCMMTMITNPRYKDATLVNIIDALDARGLIKSMRLAKKAFLVTK